MDEILGNQPDIVHAVLDAFLLTKYILTEPLTDKCECTKRTCLSRCWKLGAFLPLFNNLKYCSTAMLCQSLRVFSSTNVIESDQRPKLVQREGRRRSAAAHT